MTRTACIVTHTENTKKEVYTQSEVLVLRWSNGEKEILDGNLRLVNE